MTSHQSSTLGPPYYHSCYHQRLQSIISPPTAHLSTSNHATAVVVTHAYLSTKPQTLTNAYVAIFSAEHSSLLTQHIELGMTHA